MIKRLWLLAPLLLILGLISCDKDSIQQRNYLTEPFIVDKFTLNGQVFKIAPDDGDEHALLNMEEAQQNRHVGFIQREDINNDELNQFSYELKFVIDPKKFDVEFSNAEATIVNTDFEETVVPVYLELVDTETNRDHAFLTYKVNTSSLSEAINKQEFKHISFIVYSEYKEKKGKKTVEPRNMRFMVYVKS